MKERTNRWPAGPQKQTGSSQQWSRLFNSRDEARLKPLWQTVLSSFAESGWSGGWQASESHHHGYRCSPLCGSGESYSISLIWYGWWVLGRRFPDTVLMHLCASTASIHPYKWSVPFPLLVMSFVRLLCVQFWIDGTIHVSTQLQSYSLSSKWCRKHLWNRICQGNVQLGKSL